MFVRACVCSCFIFILFLFYYLLIFSLLGVGFQEMKNNEIDTEKDKGDLAAVAISDESASSEVDGSAPKKLRTDFSDMGTDVRRHFIFFHS